MRCWCAIDSLCTFVLLLIRLRGGFGCVWGCGFGGFGFPGCGWRSVALNLVGMVFWLVFVDLGSFVSGIFRLGWFDFGAGLDVVGFRCPWAGLFFVGLPN